MNKYLKFEYYNSCNLGNIYYAGGQHFWFYLDGDVQESFCEEVEDGQENGDGDFIPVYRRQIKRYQIKTEPLPEFFIDALYRMRLHDFVQMTWKSGEIEMIYNVVVAHEWQFDKKLATATITFDMNEKVLVTGCCS